jgi:hypothetical protein
MDADLHSLIVTTDGGFIGAVLSVNPDVIKYYRTDEWDDSGYTIINGRVLPRGDSDVRARARARVRARARTRTRAYTRGHNH